jgi:hypothetical protein
MKLPWKRTALEAVRDFPPLGWLMSAETDTGRYRVWHGRNVEISDDWVVEAVWDGAFGEGCFDRTCLVFGSGVRVREELLTVVSPGSTTERIFYQLDGTRVHASNSLPLLMALTGTRLLDTVNDYSARSSVTPPDPSQAPALPATPRAIFTLAHHNLILATGSEPLRVAKPGNGRFDTFEDYRRFLNHTADAIAGNAHSSERVHSIRMLTTISSGYDSPAGAVLAKRMGCKDAATIKEARSLVPRSDSGADVARQLGLNCTEYSRRARGFEGELLFWAGLGHPQDEHFGLFEYPEPVSLLFTGQYGGNIWAIDDHFRGPFERSDWSGLGFGEYRLNRSVIHCPVPFWGAHRAEDVLRISRSDAMKPWVLSGEYDRPVPRRLVEEAGVSRKSFGIRKSATQYDDTFLWPRDPDLDADFRSYLEERNIPIPPVKLARLWSTLYDKLLFALESRFFGRDHPRAFWLQSQGLLFQWANDRLAAAYEAHIHRQPDPK